MSRTDRILIAAMMFVIAIMCLMDHSRNLLNIKRLNAHEIQLRNMEHLLSLSLSEPRSPALTSRTNGMPAFTNEKR